ncbi:MAG: hypothetical protein ACREL5_03625 [Gemmatimonadales bacterium]
MAKLSQRRAERIARAHACENCGEFNFRKVKAQAASAEQRAELAVAWIVTRTCGVCGAISEMGIDDEGEVVFSG